MSWLCDHRKLLEGYLKHLAFFCTPVLPYDPACIFADFFVHHPLLKDSFGKKLSKSEAALSLKTLRKEKSKPSFIYRGVARSLDLPGDKIEDLKSLQQIFASIPLEKLNHRKLKDLTIL